MLHQVQTCRAMCTDAFRKRITCTIKRVTVSYQQIENGNVANHIQGFTIDYGKFIPITDSIRVAQPIRLQYLH